MTSASTLPAPNRVRALEHAANVAMLLHAHLDAAIPDGGLAPDELRRAVFEAGALAHLVERYAAAGPLDELDDWTFERSGLIARDLWHAAAEFDFAPSAADEHVAGLCYGLTELARSLGDELGPVTGASTATLDDCIAALTEALELLHRAGLQKDASLENDADALLVPVARRLLSLSSCGLGIGGRDTRLAVLGLVATMHSLPGLSVGPRLAPFDLIAAAAVVLGHLHALRARVAAGGPAPLIFAPRQETPDARLV